MTNKGNALDVVSSVDGEQHSTVERMDTPIYITEGMYARFKTTPDQSKSYTYSELYQGDILLIQKLHYADNQLHSITLKDHPRNANADNQSKSFDFLFSTFYDHFELVSKSEGDAVRTNELNALNKSIGLLKEEFADLQSNPEKLQSISFSIYSKRISSPQAPVSLNVGNVVDMLGSSNASEQIEQYSATANMAQDLAQIQLEYLQSIQKEILELSKKVMPYVVEHMAAGIASVEEQRAKFQQMNDSVASMQLYNGVGVDVYTIREGESASPEIPLTLTQERLWADVELAYFKAETASKMDVTSLGRDFFSFLAENNDLVNQIFPTERSVCIMATRKTAVEDKKPNEDQMYKMMIDEYNRDAFLLIRNGENIHAVFSPIGTHLVANNLFPSRDSLQRHFFKYGGDIQITPDSLDYAKATSNADKETLHYKRFLILIAGLQHRLNLFGQFYPEQQVFNIFNISFQEKYFNYIHDGDGEGLLADGNNKTLFDWVMEKNKVLRKGSTLICNNHAMTFNEVASGCFKYSYGWTRDNNYRQIKAPVEKFSIATCQQNKSGEFFVKIKCSNESYIDLYEKEPRITDSTYLIAEGMSGIHYSSGFTNKLLYLVLDQVSIEELEYYCSQRKYRQQYLAYIELFNEAKAYLLKVQSDSSSEFKPLMSSFGTIALKDKLFKPFEVASIISDALSFFTGANKDDSIRLYLGAKLSLHLQNRLKQNLIGSFKSPVHLATIFPEGVSPIATTINAKGQIFVYTNLPDYEQLDQLCPNCWMNRYLFINKKSPIKFELLEGNEKVSFDNHCRDERLLFAFDEEAYKSYIANTVWSMQEVHYGGGVKTTYSGLFHSYEQKMEMLKSEEESIALLRKIATNTLGREEAQRLYKALNNRNTESPLGFFVGFSDKYNRPVKVYIHKAYKWIEALYQRYQESPENKLLSQDNSCVSFYMDDFNWPDNWALDSLLCDSHNDRGDFNTPYSSRSIGFAISQYLASEATSLKYSAFADHLNTLLGVDEWLGNVNIVQPVVKLGMFKAIYYVVKKGEHTHFDSHYVYVIAETTKLEQLRDRINSKFEKLKVKRDLQRERVETHFIFSKNFVIHAEDYKGLISNFEGIHSRINENDFVWSQDNECYITKDHEDFLFG